LSDAPAIGLAPAAPRRGLSLVALRDGLTFVAVLVSFFVMMEPSPNEILVSVGLIILFATGMHFPRAAAPLLLMLLGLNIGGALSAVPVIGKEKVAIFVVISIFLMAYAIFFVMLFSENTARRLELLRKAWIIAAVITAATGIAGYFNLGGTRDLFTLYASRAKGTFNDPNVFGPYLILPFLFLVQALLIGNSRRPLLAVLAIAVIVGALFLSFSRAAWAHAIISLGLFVLLTLSTAPSARLKARITFALLVGAALLAFGLVALASVPAVRDMVLVRASLNQEYDTGAGGRFDNLRRAVDVILTNPNGIGPLEFARSVAREDPHNAYLHTFVAYGWLGGISYLAMVISTMWLGWRTVWAKTPFQPYVVAIVSTYTGVALISFVIHSDHWRHYFLLVGLIWALAAASQRWIARSGTA
jgi:O-antigen ligase